MEFSRQEHWSGLAFPSPGDLSNPGIKPRSPILQADALASHQGSLPNPSNNKQNWDGSGRSEQWRYTFPAAAKRGTTEWLGNIPSFQRRKEVKDLPQARQLSSDGWGISPRPCQFPSLGCAAFSLLLITGRTGIAVFYIFVCLQHEALFPKVSAIFGQQSFGISCVHTHAATPAVLLAQFSHSVRFSVTPWTAARQASLSIVTPGVYSNSCPSSRWCHPTISSSIIPFSCLQSFPASGSFQMSQFSTSGGQSIGVSASTSDLPMNTQDSSPLGWTGSISLQSKGLSRVFSNTTVQKHQFFGAILLRPLE